MAPTDSPTAQIEFDLEGVEPQVADAALSTEIVTDPPETTEVVVAPADEMAELRKQLDEERKLRTDAESRVTSLSAEKSTADTRLAAEVNTRFAAQEQSIDLRASTATATITTIKQEMVRAQSEQRFEDFANLQEQMAEAKLEERSASWEKKQLNTHKERVKAELEANNSQQRDPVEAFINVIPGERSRQWLRKNPDILRKAATSPSEQKRLFGYAQIAEANGHVADSDSYFDSIEQQYGLKEPDPVVAQQSQPAKAAPKPPGQTANAAPASRSAAPAQTSRRVTLDDVQRKLTNSDRANAKISFPDKTQDEAEKLYAHGLVISKQREPGFRPDIRL